ncbi:MAG: hypothetical protein MI864_27915 [Pseudomonadales bacterium]|nr:hypothetical protein [Pseudomonadales bacterium]
MKAIEIQIQQVVASLESGQITEAEAHRKIAEITTEIPEPDRLSDTVRSYMEDEINKMDIPEADKARLRLELNHTRG